MVVLKRYYVKLGVYNYDAFPRHQILDHYCGSEISARLLAKSFSIVDKPEEESHNEWLDTNHGISGFILQVYGAYSDTTEKLED